MSTLVDNWSIKEWLGLKSQLYAVTVAPNDPSFTLVVCLLHVCLVNMSDWLLFLACLFHPVSKVLSLLSRCEWLVAVGRVSRVGQVPAQPPWLTGRSRVESRHQCPGDLRPGSPYEALLKGQGGFWGNPAQRFLLFHFFWFIFWFHTLSPSLFHAHLQHTLHVDTLRSLCISLIAFSSL